MVQGGEDDRGVAAGDDVCGVAVTMGEEEEAFSPASTASAMSLSSDASPVPSPAPSAASTTSSEASSSSSSSLSSSSSSTTTSSGDWPTEPSRAGPVRGLRPSASSARRMGGAAWRPHCHPGRGEASEDEENGNCPVPAATHRSGYDEALQAAFRGAADAWDCARVAQLLRDGVVDVDRYGEDGRTPLLRALASCAAGRGHGEEEEEEEEDDEEEEEGSERGRRAPKVCPTPQQRLALVRLLVQHGADVTRRTREGWSALHVASFGDCPEVVSFLLRCGRR